MKNASWKETISRKKNECKYKVVCKIAVSLYIEVAISLCVMHFHLKILSTFIQAVKLKANDNKNERTSGVFLKQLPQQSVYSLSVV